jgi:hypothetical protein
MTSNKLVVKAPLLNLVLLQILLWKRRLAKKGMELIPAKKGKLAVKLFEKLEKVGGCCGESGDDWERGFGVAGIGLGSIMVVC